MAHTVQREESEDRRCIWMLAGVVDYKICNLEYRCEQCQFENAIHGEPSFLLGKTAADECESEIDTGPATPDSSEIHQVVGACIQRMLTGCHVKLDRMYYHPYLWSKAVSADVLQMGLNLLSSRILQPVTRVILPDPGTHIRKKQLLGWIVRPDMFVPVHSPVDGTVLDVNPSINEHNIASVLEREDVLFTLHADEAKEIDEERSNFSLYLSFCARAVRVIRRHLLEQVSGAPGPGLGPTLADGGAPEPDLRRILGPERFDDIVQQLLGNDAYGSA